MTPQFDYRMGVASAAIGIALSKLQHAELEAGYGTVEASRIHDAIEAIADAKATMLRQLGKCDEKESPTKAELIALVEAFA